MFLAVQAVENQDALDAFDRDVLAPLGASYPFRAVVEGNDPRRMSDEPNWMTVPASPRGYGKPPSPDPIRRMLPGCRYRMVARHPGCVGYPTGSSRSSGSAGRTGLIGS
jgi:hypothetical protein